MKILFFPLLLTFLCQPLFGQGIIFQKGPFDNVLKQAQKEKKLVFLHIDSPTCAQCTEVATKGFTSSTLTEKYATHFVSYRVSGGSDEGKALLKRYELKSPLVSLYLQSDGSLIHRHEGSSSFAFLYLEEADKALAAQSQTSLGELDKRYTSGDRSLPFLRDYMNRRRKLNLPTSDLLDAYVRQLPADSLRAMSTFEVLFEQVPVLGTYADSVMRFDNKVWNERFFTHSPPQRIAFNRTLNQKTMQQAIATKNQPLALRMARYTAGTYGSDRPSGRRAYETEMINYFWGVKDTTGYIQVARQYYNIHIMPMNVDSLKRIEQQKRQDAFRPAPGETNTIVKIGPSRYGQDLNGAAWRFWQVATQPDDLETALRWSKRALEFDENQTGYRDTYAHLLYKLGRRDEAIREEERVIADMKLRKSPVASFEQTLQRMKDGTLVPEVD